MASVWPTIRSSRRVASWKVDGIVGQRRAVGQFRPVGKQFDFRFQRLVGIQRVVGQQHQYRRRGDHPLIVGTIRRCRPRHQRRPW